jgi:hypothetical protein
LCVVTGSAVLRTGCLNAATSAATRGDLDPGVLAERLLLAVYAYGTNTGIRAVRGREKPLGGLRSLGQLLSVGFGMGEAGMPAAEVVGQVVVEDPGADLEQHVCASGRPAHLLLLTMRLEMTWLIADSTKELEMVSPARWRSP